MQRNHELHELNTNDTNSFFDLCHAVSIYAVVDTDLPGNCTDPYGMTNVKRQKTNEK